MKKKRNKTMATLERRPVFVQMSDTQANDYIICYIKNRFPRSGPLIGKLPISERDDAVQEIYIDLWENRFRYDPEKADFSTYAFNRGRGVVKDLLTKKNKIYRVASKIFEERPRNFYLEKSINESVEQVEKILCKIKPEHAQIMKMRFVDDMTIDAIAKKINCSKQKVYQVISRACEDGKRCINN
jgi:RNA polymerase sigma factor (sigma-70 family)